MHEPFFIGRRKKMSIDLFGTLPVPLSIFASSIGDGFLHIYGGQKGNNTYNASYFYQNLLTKQWGTGATTSPANYFASGFYINRPTEGKRFYTEGGWNIGSGVNGASWWFGATGATSGGSGNAYTTGDTPYRTEKKMLCPDNENVYMVAGYDGTNTISKFSKFQFSTGLHTVLAPVPKAVNGHTVGWYNGKLYCAAGYSSQAPAGDTTAVYQYDPGANTWKKITDAPAATSWTGGCIYKNLLVLPMTTNVSNGSFFNIAIYNLDTGVWRVKSSGLVAHVGAEYVPDPLINKGVFILGGIQGNYVGGTNWEANARFNTQYLINEDWLYY